MNEKIPGKPQDTSGTTPFGKETLEEDGATLTSPLRIRLEYPRKIDLSFEIVLDQEVVLGVASDLPCASALTAMDARSQGVSRRHALVKMVDDSPQIVDSGSTNGTFVNGRALRPQEPFPLADGDLISLGKLDLIVRFQTTKTDRRKVKMATADPADALSYLAKTLTAELNLDEVLKRALTLAKTLTAAGEVALWLLDDKTNELFLEAESGIKDEEIRRLRLPASDRMVSTVLHTGKPLRANREADGKLIKVKTGYVVEALLYVPILYGEDKLGVLAGTHRDTGATFSARDERLLSDIADFAAIAIHNARVYQDLHKANNLKNEMIQNISHEFRTPLQYIVGYIGLMLEDKTNLPEDHRGYLEVLNKQLQRLTWLVENFVTLQSVSHIVSRKVSTDLGSLLNGVAQSAKVLADEKQISMEVEVPEDLPRAMVNPMAIFQVLDNLISNALKFTDPKGTVTISARAIEKEGAIEVLVRDTGVGISEADLPRIFDRFYQADGSLTRRFGGVGLGLTVCKEIVEQHGGQIRVESEEGKGSNFYFTVPLTSEQSAWEW